MGAMENRAELCEHARKEGGRGVHEEDTPSPSYTDLIRLQRASTNYIHKEKDMKRLFPALFLGLVVALVGASGVASADPPNDFTTGGGKLERTQGARTIEEKFAFSAHDEDDSVSTTAARNGHYVYEQTITTPMSTSEFDLKGSVDCVRVSGNQAGFSGLIEKSSNNPSLEGLRAFFSVADNDSIGTPDEFRFIGVSASTLPCILSPSAPITSGNILVSDAQ